MSGAYVGGFPDGGFQRVRDNASGGFAAEFNREKKAAEERERQKQAEQDRINRKQADEEEKRRIANEQKAMQAFRDFHDPRKRGEITANVMKYTEARGYRRENYRIANAELLNPEFKKVYMPERFAQQQGEAELKADYEKLARCEFCRICFMTEEELAAHLRDTRPCPHRCGLCSAGGDIHRCSVYGGRIEEDRAPARKYEGEE